MLTQRTKMAALSEEESLPRILALLEDMAFPEYCGARDKSIRTAHSPSITQDNARD